MNGSVRDGWPDLGRERIMSDAEIVEQGHRIELRKVLLRQTTVECERCGKNTAIRSERYCMKCRILVLEELEDCGYLQPEVPCNYEWREPDAKENVLETKYGTEHGGCTALY